MISFREMLQRTVGPMLELDFAELTRDRDGLRATVADLHDQLDDAWVKLDRASVAPRPCGQRPTAMDRLEFLPASSELSRVKAENTRLKAAAAARENLIARLEGRDEQ